MNDNMLAIELGATTSSYPGWDAELIVERIWKDLGGNRRRARHTPRARGCTSLSGCRQPVPMASTGCGRDWRRGRHRHVHLRWLWHPLAYSGVRRLVESVPCSEGDQPRCTTSVTPGAAGSEGGPRRLHDSPTALPGGRRLSRLRPLWPPSVHHSALFVVATSVASSRISTHRDHRCGLLTIG